MASKKFTLESLVLSKYPQLLRAIPSPGNLPAKNHFASKAQKIIRANKRYKTRKDVYFGKADRLRKNAIIRLLLEQDHGFSNSDILDLLLNGLNHNRLNAQNLKIELTDPYKIIDYLRCIYQVPGLRFFQQDQLLGLLSKDALDEIYSAVFRDEIRDQGRRDKSNFRKYGHTASPRGGRRKKSVKRKQNRTRRR